MEELLRRIDSLQEKVTHLEGVSVKAECKATQAQTTTLALVETVKHYQSSLEASHSQMGEMLAASKKLTVLIDQITKHQPCTC